MRFDFKKGKTMRITWILPGIAAVTLSAQAPPARPMGFSPPMPSAELAKQPQTKGAKGDQQRHYYFEAAKRAHYGCNQCQPHPADEPQYAGLGPRHLEGV